jgi:hypothetical protein
MSNRIWIDTTSGTWGAVEHGQGRLVVLDVDDIQLEALDWATDSDIADLGNRDGRVPTLASDFTPAAVMYVKCAHCHLFVEPNEAHDNDATLAQYVHLHRGTPADERLDESHEAEPSPFEANLATWRVFGPPEMRERFIDQSGNPIT